MAAYYPGLDDIRRLCDSGRRASIYRRMLADRLTPVGVFAALSKGAERAFLLESVIGGDYVARYSFIGANPAGVLRARGSTCEIIEASGTSRRLTGVRDPLALLHELLLVRPTAATQHSPHALPRFVGGAVGYAGYDTVRYYENLPDAPVDDRGLDDLEFGIYESLVAIDHVNNTMLILAHVDPRNGDVANAYAAACQMIDQTIMRLQDRRPAWREDLELDARPINGWRSTLTREEYERAVRRAKEYIAAGDVFQVVLSQRLRTPSTADPFDIYRALRVVNPSPFMFFLKGPRCTLVGASPEILCRVEDNVITNRPLAGTRPRGRTPPEDARLEAELRTDPKDRAEHVMLVDLARNDVGRVAMPGSVRIDRVMDIERYSHVMHLSSNVTGRLAENRTAMDALRACLPVGTVSGAPKIRAMQIIDELEPVKRGPYGGAVGYIDFTGNMDTCIALRTLVLTPCDNDTWTVDVQAGAGIVADSDPSAEYEESMNKARAMMQAVAMAAR